MTLRRGGCCQPNFDNARILGVYGPPTHPLGGEVKERTEEEGIKQPFPRV